VLDLWPRVGKSRVLAGDQCGADVFPRISGPEFQREGYRPETSARSFEVNSTGPSVLVPRDTYGARHAAVLGVATFAHLPYCFFNLITPEFSLVYGFLEFRMDKFKILYSDADPAIAGSPSSKGRN
jgi:Na+:H+ antiporter, NhaC family